MYTLYIGNRNYSSWSLRPWLLMTTLEIPFVEKLVPFDDGGSWQKFRQFSPTGRVPTLHDGAAGDRVVWESAAIVEYLAERHPGVWPSDPDARAWARCAAAEMHAGYATLRNECPMTVGQRIRLHRRSAALDADLSRLGELWDQGLTRFGGTFLAGARFSAVDAFFAPVAFRVRTFGLELPGPAAAYVDRLLHLPGMQAWEAAALVEPWREPSHETEIAALGECVEDHRQAAEECS